MICGIAPAHLKFHFVTCLPEVIFQPEPLQQFHGAFLLLSYGPFATCYRVVVRPVRPIYVKSGGSPT